MGIGEDTIPVRAHREASLGAKINYNAIRLISSNCGHKPGSFRYYSEVIWRCSLGMLVVDPLSLYMALAGRSDPLAGQYSPMASLSHA